MLLRIVMVFALSALALSSQTVRQIRAGAFAADITPRQWPVGLIGGFTQPLAESAHDALHVRAVVLDDGRAKVAIVVADSCYMPRALFDAAGKLAAAGTGIPPSHMIMAATHTHSAPPSKPEGASTIELSYQELLRKQIAQAVIEAHRRLQPAQIGWIARQEPDELHNRRW